jgi:hypothetical protein
LNSLAASVAWDLPLLNLSAACLVSFSLMVVLSFQLHSRSRPVPLASIRALRTIVFLEGNFTLADN